MTEFYLSTMTATLETFYLACPKCMSGAEGQSLLAANSAIGLMLAVLLAVLASFFSFIVYLAKRSKCFADEVPGEGDGAGGRPNFEKAETV
ncbi:MAG: hypothetical protein WD342_16420 [Verrucomicrobiales bacterium]